MSDFDEKLIGRLNRLGREVERLQVKERPDVITYNFVTMSGLSDDTATSFSPANKRGFLFFRRLDGATGAVISFDAISDTAYCFKIAGSVSIETRTGALTGTTGTDNVITISAHTDGKIYIENRLGTTLYGGYITL